MENIDPQAYCVLRLGGAAATRACAELGVRTGRGAALEHHFRRRRKEPDDVRRFGSGDAAHVTASLAAGGFPVLP